MGLVFSGTLSRHESDVVKMAAAAAAAHAASPPASPAPPAPALVLEDHFAIDGPALASGSFGEVFHLRPLAPGEALVRAHLRALGRPAEGALPQLIVKAPTRAGRAYAQQSAADRQAREDEVAREKAALAAWHHRGIVTFFGDFCGRNDARARIVLEACLGMGDGPVPILDGNHRALDNDSMGASRGDFWRWVATRVQPSDATFRFIAWQVLAPVSYLHAHGVAHRDLKNENLLVAGSVRTAAGEDVPVMKLSDFGSARALTLVEQTGPQLRQGTIARGIDGAPKYVGTPQHIAPEILALISRGLTQEAAAAHYAGGTEAPLIEFRGAYSTKCDVYSLGVALFAVLMNGFKPLNGEEDVMEIKAQVLDGSVLRIARRRMDQRTLRAATGHLTATPHAVEAATRDLVLSMLELDPGARPSAAALLASAYFDGIRAEARRLFGHEVGDVDLEKAKAAAAAGGAAAMP